VDYCLNWWHLHIDESLLSEWHMRDIYMMHRWCVWTKLLRFLQFVTFTWLTLFVYVQICVTWLIYTYHMTNLYVWRDSSICETCDMCDIWCVWRDSSICVTRDIHR